MCANKMSSEHIWQEDKRTNPHTHPSSPPPFECIDGKEMKKGKTMIDGAWRGLSEGIKI